MNVLRTIIELFMRTMLGVMVISFMLDLGTTPSIYVRIIIAVWMLFPAWDSLTELWKHIKQIKQRRKMRQNK